MLEWGLVRPSSINPTSAPGSAIPRVGWANSHLMLLGASVAFSLMCVTLILSVYVSSTHTVACSFLGKRFKRNLLLL